MDEILVVLVTFSSEVKARQIGTALLEKQLIACINCLSGVTSLYRWQGKVCEDNETLGIVKAKRSDWKALEKEISTLHPYDVPEIVALQPAEVFEPYAAWVMGK